MARAFAGVGLACVFAFLGQILGHNLYRVVRVPSGVDDVVHVAILASMALLETSIALVRAAVEACERARGMR